MDHFLQLRILEAMLFAAAEPVDEKILSERMPEGTDVKALLEELRGLYDNRGVRLLRIGKGWAFRTAEDLAPYLRVENVVTRRMSRAAVETLAIIAYHQPITRAEIEEMRGVALSKGTLDLLLEVGWIRPRGRRRTAGRPVTWGTSEAFLNHFGIENIDTLPGMDELRAAGLLDRKPGFGPLSALREQATAEEGEDEAALSEDEASVVESELESIADEERAREALASEEAGAEDADDGEEPAEDALEEDDLQPLSRIARPHGGE